MMKKLLCAVLFTLGCSTTTSSTDYKITGDECRLYNDATSCDEHSPCHWYDLGIPCQEGQPCTSGVCSAPGGGGSGSGSGSGGGSGSGSAGCACPDGGACYEQIGGPAQQAGSEPQIECGPAYACPGGGIPCDPCASISGQGTCTLDPNVANLCICDNGIR